MLKLHQYALNNGVNFSPFCFKVEVYCKLANIPYEIVPNMPNKAPKGKLPFIDDNGKIVADSGFILEYLKQTRGDVLDSGLSDEQRALGHFVRRLCEESLLFTLLYSRWIDDAYWPSVKKKFFEGMPPVIGTIVPAIVRRSIRKSLYAQGYGRHSQDEVYSLGKADLKALETTLTKTKFAVGDKPTSYDATVFAFLSSCANANFSSPLRDAIEQSLPLTAYIARMDELLKAR